MNKDIVYFEFEGYGNGFTGESKMQYYKATLNLSDVHSTLDNYDCCNMMDDSDNFIVGSHTLNIKIMTGKFKEHLDIEALQNKVMCRELYE